MHATAARATRPRPRRPGPGPARPACAVPDGPALLTDGAQVFAKARGFLWPLAPAAVALLQQSFAGVAAPRPIPAARLAACRRAPGVIASQQQVQWLAHLLGYRAACTAPDGLLSDGAGGAVAKVGAFVWRVAPAALQLIQMNYGNPQPAPVSPAQLAGCRQAAGTVTTAAQAQWLAGKLGLKPVCSLAQGAVVNCPPSPNIYVMQGGQLHHMDYGYWSNMGSPAATPDCLQVQACPLGGDFTVPPGIPTGASQFNTNPSQNDFTNSRACGYSMPTDPNGYNTAIATELCAQLGVTGQCVGNTGAGIPTGALCGKYLNVTNADTGASLRVMVVDLRGSAEGGLGLDLSEAAFQALDTNGAGAASGRLNVLVSLAS